MKTRLSPRESLILYAFIVGFVFLFYMVGLFLGKEYFTTADSSTENLPISDAPAPDLKPQLDFYKELISPQESLLSPGQAPQAERERASAPVQEPSNRRIFRTVQVAVVPQEKDARQILIRLEAKNYSGRVQPPQEGKDRYYRVLVGEFTTLEEARQMQARLKEDGFPTFIR